MNTNKRRICTNRGQAVFEYAVILGIVVLALSLMQTYVRRGIQAGIKVAADELGTQQGSVEQDPSKGTVQESSINSSASVRQTSAVTAGGASSLSLDEKTTASGSSEYWSNWQKE